MPNKLINLHDAIKAINPDAQFQYWEEDVESIVWTNGTTQ